MNSRLHSLTKEAAHDLRGETPAHGVLHATIWSAGATLAGHDPTISSEAQHLVSGSLGLVSVAILYNAFRKVRQQALEQEAWEEGLRQYKKFLPKTPGT